MGYLPNIENLFYIKRGKGGYIETFADGTTPLVSATTSNNGVARFVNDRPKFKAPVITVERVTGAAFVQLIDFSTVPDDITVLIPKDKMQIEKLCAVAGIINSSKWRFSYARKLTPTRLKKLVIPDNLTIIKSFKIRDMLPPRKPIRPDKLQIKHYGYLPITSLCHLHSGDYHNASALPDGKIPLVSCGETNNGIIGHYSIPLEKTYENTLTIAFNGSWPLLTKFHPYKFGAKDDVAVCIPKTPLKLSTLVYLQYVINRECWRYSYGRKCFREKLSNIKLKVPIKPDGTIDEDVIEQIVSNTSYWEYFNSITKNQ